MQPESCSFELAAQMLLVNSVKNTAKCTEEMRTSMSTQSIMTTQGVADTLVKLCSQGKWDEAYKTLYSPDIVSMEAGAPPGGSREAKGLQAVMAKAEWWTTNHDIHSAKVEGPLVAGSHFAVTFKMDITFKPQAKRMQMEEIAVYKVVDGKIVYEEFFYNM
jgi:hypothetical protein